jgi:hypothetical protein
VPERRQCIGEIGCVHAAAHQENMYRSGMNLDDAHRIIPMVPKAVQWSSFPTTDIVGKPLWPEGGTYQALFRANPQV